MGLLNFTTKVDAAKTIAEIQSILVRAGARQIMATYDGEGNPTGVGFAIDTEFGTRAFTLPVNVEKVLAVLSRDKTVERRFKNRAQAERTAWRILKDWIEAQTAIVATEMVTLEQTMLAYMHTDPAGTTVYEAFLGSQLALPAGDRG